MSTGAGDTGTRDEYFDLISVLYHALEGAATYARYVQDAERAGDQELAAFFREVQTQNQARTERVKELLAQRFVPGQAPPVEGIPAAQPPS